MRLNMMGDKARHFLSGQQMATSVFHIIEQFPGPAFELAYLFLYFWNLVQMKLVQIQ